MVGGIAPEERCVDTGDAGNRRWLAENAGPKKVLNMHKSENEWLERSENVDQNIMVWQGLYTWLYWRLEFFPPKASVKSLVPPIDTAHTISEQVSDFGAIHF